MKHSVANHPQIRSGIALVAAVVIAFAICAQRIYGQDIVKLDRFVQAKGNTASMQIFREGRDFIEAQNWQKAAEKFNAFITGYPKDKDLDAALYWYGYALQKQDRKEEAAAPLVRLINRFPNSNWRNDAQALLVVLGRKADVEVVALPLPAIYSGDWGSPHLYLVPYAVRVINPTTQATLFEIKR